MYTRNAFTLIELMIAIALGMIIIFVSTAAFRIAAQSVAKANRLSLENAILRAGVEIAHHDLDFWTNVDDPDNPKEQELRACSGNKGLPFTELSTAWLSAKNVGNDEGSVGYDPRDTAWAMGNPRVWWRGNMAEKNATDLRFGRYALFSNTDINLIKMGSSTMGSGNYNNGTAIAIPHSWLYNQIKNTALTLGYYGLCDYLPANALYAYYGPFLTKSQDNENYTNLGGMPMWTVNPSGPFNNGDGSQRTPRGKYRNSYMTSYGIIDPDSTNNKSTLINNHRKNYRLGYGSKEGDHDQFNKISAIPDNMLPERPEHWPGLKISVQRLIKNTRFVNLARIGWDNAQTGETIELSFTSFTTTLRGARQQRSPGGGWADWRNEPSSPNPTTLDGNPVSP